MNADTARALRLLHEQQEHLRDLVSTMGAGLDARLLMLERLVAECAALELPPGTPPALAGLVSLCAAWRGEGAHAAHPCIAALESKVAAWDQYAAEISRLIARLESGEGR